MSDQKKEEGEASHSIDQHVTTLPPALAEDRLLRQLLNPGDAVQYSSAALDPNVTTINTRQGEEKNAREGKKAIEGPGQKIIQFDPKRGFVSTSFAEYKNRHAGKDNGKDDNLTENKRGIFVKHLTTTVMNPGKGAGIDGSIHLTSSNFASSNLQNNIWTNVLVYKPKGRVYEYDPKTGKMNAVQQSPGESEANQREPQS